MFKGYSQKFDPGKTVRARGRDLRISPKKSYELCNALRGKLVKDVETLLEDIIALKRPIKIKRYNQETAHKRVIGPGRYPQGAARQILKVLQNAKSIAEARSEEGFDPDEMRVVHIAASRGRIIYGRMPRAHGRSTNWNEQTTNIELVLEKVEEKGAEEESETAKRGSKK